MNRIISFLIMTLWSLQVFTQVSATTQALDCYNDSGNVFLVFNSSITVSSIEWKYSPHNVSDWLDVSLVSTPFVSLNDFQDSLRTIKCGLYKAIYEFSVGSQLYFDSLQWSLSCPLTVGLGKEPILCYGDSTGVLKRPVFGGNPFINNAGDDYYYYEWIFSDDSVGTNSYYFLDTTETLDSLSAGWYKTVITDNSGCTNALDFIEFKNPPLMSGSTTFIDDLYCRNINNGKFGFQVTGGKKYNLSNKYFYYLLLEEDTIIFSDNTGSSVNFIDNSFSLNMQSLYIDSIQFDSLMAGEYVLHVLDSNSCLLIDTIIVSQPAPYQAFASTITPLICETDSGYLYIDSVLNGGNIDFGFIGPNSDSIYVSTGLYEIYINDLDYGCLDTVYVRSYAQYEIEVFNTIINNSCHSDVLGAVQIDSIIGGNFPYDVQWGGLNNNTLAANTYSVFIVDAIGCVHTEEFTVTQPNQVDPNEVIVTPSCYGSSDGVITIDPSGGSGILLLEWVNANGSSVTGNSDSLYGLSSGIYTLVVTDSLSCVDSFTFILSDPDSLIISFSDFQDSLVCYGEEILLNLLISGGTAPFSILWDDGDTTQQKIIGAGNYLCTVTDANGCIALKSLEIFEPELLSVNLLYTDITCDQGGSASISVDGGVEPIEIIWNTGETLNSIDSLWGTIYWVIVTDSCGNSASDTFEIYPYMIETSVFYDDSTHVGSVEIDTCTSLGAFSFQWVDILGNVISSSNSLSLFSSLSNLCEGTYFITTIDESTNCSIIDTLIVTYYLPNGILDETITTVFPDSNLWGNPPYTYFWDNAETTAHANVCSGAHWVEVTDNDNCVVRVDFDIEPILITLNPVEFIIECNLQNLDVEIIADATGGTAPYTYYWPNGSVDNSINLNLSPGNHSVTVMDNNFCTEDTSFTIATMSADCVPNVFTPNGDNVNDTWNLESTFLFSDSEIRIFGRFGRLLFQSVGYNIPWDGKNENGNDVTEGAYFYHIEIGHDFEPIQGSLTIIR